MCVCTALGHNIFFFFQWICVFSVFGIVIYLYRQGSIYSITCRIGILRNGYNSIGIRRVVMDTSQFIMSLVINQTWLSLCNDCNQIYPHVFDVPCINFWNGLCCCVSHFPLLSIYFLFIDVWTYTHEDTFLLALTALTVVYSVSTWWRSPRCFSALFVLFAIYYW